MKSTKSLNNDYFEKKGKYFIDGHGIKRSWRAHDKNLNLVWSERWPSKCDICGLFFSERGKIQHQNYYKRAKSRFKKFKSRK